MAKGLYEYVEEWRTEWKADRMIHPIPHTYDPELDSPKRKYWGTPKQRRWLKKVMKKLDKEWAKTLKDPDYPNRKIMEEFLEEYI